MNLTLSLILVFVWMLVFSLTGSALLQIVTPRRRLTFTLLCIGPAVGLAVYMLLAIVTGWLFGMLHGITISISVVLVGWAAWKLRNRIVFFILISLFGCLLSLAPLATVVHIGDFPYFQDAFTYVSHSQWLQNHQFKIPVESDPYHPMYTQIAIYQRLDLRMGASFLLAWIQSASTLSWATDAYPATAIIFVLVAASAIAGAVGAIFPGRRSLAITTGIAAAVSVGGLGYGATQGFFPQTCALALWSATLALLTSMLGGHTRMSWINLLPVAILFTTIGYTYPELLPFSIASIGIWFINILLTERHMRIEWLRRGVYFFVISLLLWNFELQRIYNSLVTQSQVVAGWAVPWSNFEFFAHSLGLLSGSSDSSLFVTSVYGVQLVIVIVLCIYASLLVSIISKKSSRKPWVPVVSYLMFCVMAYLIFRYISVSPWPIGQGQTWNQFKLANWSSPAWLIFTGAAFAYWARNKLVCTAAHAILLGLALAGAVTHHRLSNDRMAETIRQTGRASQPLSVYKDLRTTILALNDGKPIYLDLGGQSHKSRQMAAFFLYDLPLVSDWSDDGYIYQWLGKRGNEYNISECKLIVQRSGQIHRGSRTEFLAQIGSLSVIKLPEFYATCVGIEGAHNQESDSSGWWAWSAGTVNLNFKIHKGYDAPMNFVAEVRPASLPRDLTVEIISDNRVIASHNVDLSINNTLKIGPIMADTDEIKIRLSSSNPLVQLSASDLRMSGFMIKNANLESIAKSNIKKTIKAL